MSILSKLLGPQKKQCDVCNKQPLDEYCDARIRIAQRVAWANVCVPCWHEYGMGTFGPGLGQFFAWDDALGCYVKLRG